MARYRGVALAAVLATAALTVLAAPASATTPDERIEAALLGAVRDAGFDRVIDFGAVEGACPGPRCPAPTPRTAHAPNADVAVIELDDAGRPVGAANVLLSRDHPTGVGVPLDADLAATSVRFRRWDAERWNGTRGWTSAPPPTSADDLVAGREGAPLQFMSPYPASLFSVLVAFRTLQLVDRGDLRLDTAYAYTPAGSGCPERAASATRTVEQFLDAMVAGSSTPAACALLKLLHDRGEVDGLNAEMRRLGLGTLQVEGTSPQDGGGWEPGRINVTAMDLARLLWLVDGARDALWTGADGRPVREDVLSDASRRLLKGLLAEQGLNEALSTANWCGLEYPAPGIAQVVADRWIDPSDGAVTVGDLAFGPDVRPCNAAAGVTFAHRTGLGYTSGADAGIVHSLPGRPERHYVIAMLSTLGYRYADPRFADATALPCLGSPGFCYTEKIAQLGAQVDDAIATGER